MVLEILGARIIAPFFGTTIIVWSNLIGVVLIAMALGYYLGGSLADKTQKPKYITQLLFAASIAIFLIVPIYKYILVHIGGSIGIGSLVSAFLFLTMPGILSGMIITYTIRIFTHSIDTLGKISGNLYGISTLGSIAGVFFTSLILIPNFSVRTIIISAGATLLLLSLLSKISLTSSSS